MPWTYRSAKKHTRKATTKAKQKQWARTANFMLKRTGSEARAMRAANAAVKRKRKR